MLTAKHLMTKGLVTITMDASLEEVRGVFEAHGFQHLVVVERGRPVGVISDRDVLREVSPFIGKVSERSVDSATLHRKAHQIMSRKIHTAEIETEASEVIRLMLDKEISCVPIVDAEGWCAGIITRSDILGWCADSISSARESAEAVNQNDEDAPASAAQAA